ncbi:MAG TPA: VOC family protein [Candidatus Saccharimonadales bacterium]|nr:VOC family protein [Candidatus Saccharimonadales bacterium]
MDPIKPFIWFENQAEEAMNYYVETFPNSKISHIERYAGKQGIPGEKELEGKVLTGVFQLNGMEFQCLDGGPVFKPGGNVSFVVEFDDQDGLDKVWARLLDGGKTQQCGWITDKFGTTWQIIPKLLGQLMTKGNVAQKKAVMQAMMPMVKLESEPLQKAFDSAKRSLDTLEMTAG